MNTNKSTVYWPWVGKRYINEDKKERVKGEGERRG